MDVDWIGILIAYIGVVVFVYIILSSILLQIFSRHAVKDVNY